jgi:hypothetical protein
LLPGPPGIESWVPGFDRRGLLHCHLSWHAAANIHPGASGPPLNVVTDSAAFLWRAEIAERERQPEVWREVHAYALRSFPKAGVPSPCPHRARVRGGWRHAELERQVGQIRDRIAAGR